MENKKEEKKKGFFARLLERFDKKLEEASKKGSCCGQSKNDKGNSCCG